MKKRKVAKKVKATRTRRADDQANLFYGLEHEFVIIVGGGFLVVVFGLLLLFRI